MPTSRQLSITVSIGVSDPSDPDLSPEEILKKADAALYRAKDEGRNRLFRADGREIVDSDSSRH